MPSILQKQNADVDTTPLPALCFELIAAGSSRKDGIPVVLNCRKGNYMRYEDITNYTKGLVGQGDELQDWYIAFEVSSGIIATSSASGSDRERG